MSSEWQALRRKDRITVFSEEYYFETMVAIEAGVFVASAFVLSFVYVSFLKRMVDNSSKMSREREESQRLREDYRH